MTGGPDSGYAGAPLSRKLGIDSGNRCAVIDPPEGVLRWLAPLPADVRIEDRPTAATDLALVFAVSKGALRDHLQHCRGAMRPGAALWVCWPKRASNVATDITEGTVREFGRALGYVDVKVCAVGTAWSGLKLAVRAAPL